MKTKTLVVVVAAAISTATCAAVTVAPTKEEALPPAVLADQFHPPFGTFVLNPAFIQAAKVTQITRSHDRLLEDGSLLSDVETFVYTFTPQGEPLSIVELLRGKRFSSTENTYDGAGRLSQSVRSIEERLPITRTFTYDAQSRLVTVEESGALSSKTHHHYEGGRLSRRVFAGSGEEAVEKITSEH